MLMSELSSKVNSRSQYIPGGGNPDSACNCMYALNWHAVGTLDLYVRKMRSKYVDHFYDIVHVCVGNPGWLIC